MNITTSLATANVDCSSVLTETCVAWTEVGINDQIASLANNLNIYPNPSNGTFSMELQNGRGIYLMTVYDMMGSLIVSKSINFANEKTIQFEIKEKGIYVVSLVGEAGRITKKIIVQ